MGKVTPVYVYASGDEVELFVNGVSQGRRKREKGLWRFRFNEVIYQPGEVRAVAYRNGAKWAEETVRTAGAPARLVATPERTRLAFDGEDVGYVTLKVVDKDGNLCPTAKIPVTVSVSGAGRFLAVENGDETDFTWLRDPSRRTFNGLLSALVVATPGATGKISVTFTAEGLAPATALLDATRRMCYIAWDGEDCDMSSVLGMSPPCCSLRCSDTRYPIRGYQTNSLTTPRTGPERHVPVPNAAHQARMSRTWPGAQSTRAASARGTVQRTVRTDGFDCRLCGHIGPHFIKNGLRRMDCSRHRRRACGWALRRERAFKGGDEGGGKIGAITSKT